MTRLSSRCHGQTLTAGAQKAGQDPQAAFKAREQAIPARRFGSADEFGAVCASLCKVQAGYLTGQNILLDGGAFFEHVLTSVPREPSQAFLNARSDAYQGDSAGQNAPR